MTDAQRALVLEADALNRQCVQIIRDIRKMRLDQGVLVPLMNKPNRPAIVDTVLRPKPVTPPEDFRRTLNGIYSDKMYLERLYMGEQLRALFLMRPSMTDAHSKMVHRICIESINAGLANNGGWIRKRLLSKLEGLQKYFLQQTEFEFWDRVQQRVIKPAKVRQKAVSNVELQQVTKSIVELWKDFDDHKFAKVVRIGKRLMEKASAWKKHKELGKVWFVLGDLIHLIGNAFVELRMYSQAHDLFIMEGELSDECNSVMFEKRHLDNMARLYCVAGLYESAIEWFNTRNNYSSEGLEKVWLDYQMALCFFCDEQYEQAKEKVTSFLKNARGQGLTEWEFNGELLLAALFSCLPLGRSESLKECCSAVERSLLCALKLDDTARINVAFKFLQVCYNAVLDKGLPTTAYFSRSVEQMCSKEYGDNQECVSRWLRESLLPEEEEDEETRKNDSTS